MLTALAAKQVKRPVKLDGRHVGQEFDAWAEWKIKDAVELGLGYARFFRGPFLNRTTSGKNFNYPFVYLTYDFTQSKSPPK